MLNVHDQDGVRVVELDHGKVNALDLELLDALSSTVRETEGALVLTGRGRTFSAGVDLRRIVDGGSDYVREFLRALSASFVTVLEHPAPVVAAVNGPAIAGGAVIAAACDRRVLARGPIGFAELAVGVPFPTSAIEIIRGVVGPRASDLVLTARNLDGQEALAVGLVDELVGPDDLLDTAVSHAARLAALPPGVFAHTKRQLQGPIRQRIDARRDLDDPLMDELWSSSAVQRAIDAYLTDLASRSR